MLRLDIVCVIQRLLFIGPPSAVTPTSSMVFVFEPPDLLRFSSLKRSTVNACHRYVSFLHGRMSTDDNDNPSRFASDLILRSSFRVMRTLTCSEHFSEARFLGRPRGRRLLAVLLPCMETLYFMYTQ